MCADVTTAPVPALAPEPHVRSRYAADNLGRMRRRPPLEGDLRVDLCVIGGKEIAEKNATKITIGVFCKDKCKRDKEEPSELT